MSKVVKRKVKCQTPKVKSSSKFLPAAGRQMLKSNFGEELLWAFSHLDFICHLDFGFCH